MNSFRLHTDSIINVMKQLGPNSLTVAVIMDLQDCSSPPLYPSSPTDNIDTGFPNSLAQTIEERKTSPCDLTLTVRALHSSLSKGGRVFWRSSAMDPWYKELYLREGFKVERVHVREVGSKIPIDRVNMYVFLSLIYESSLMG
jgi:betaine lipid synthase